MSARNEPTVGELFGSLANSTGTLVRQEVQLATTEMEEKARTLVRDAALLGAGGAVAYAGLLALMLAAVLALGLLIPMWLAALGVGLLAVGVGYGLVQRGLVVLRGLSPVPKETVKTLKDDVSWAKEQLR